MRSSFAIAHDPLSPASIDARQERQLATARLTLTAASLLAIYLDPTEPVRYAHLAYGLLLVYSAWSIALFLLTWRLPALTRFRAYFHTVDIVWAATISLFTDGPNSPFFLFFVFALLAAAYRWGMRETLLTVSAVIGILGAEAALLAFHLTPFVVGEFEVNRFIMRATYALILAVLMGYLAEAQARERRTTALALERSRIARDLHDGPLQSLLAIEVRLDVLRRLANSGVPEREIAALQEVVREQAVTLREVMHELKPAPADPQQLNEQIGNLAYRFENETGIAVDCAVELDEDPLAPRLCAELLRIVQEALVNIRKHSHATHVVVRLGTYDGGLRLIIDDDGRGFPFQGRLDHHDLLDSRKGPIMIKERVAAIGGRMAIQSSARGARIEVTFDRSRQGVTA
ncbi:MAG TPA: sensor histidine kinase [Terriglobales bacterium]|nr:sensor histidine kinase [Terriglobales bacterium]